MDEAPGIREFLRKMASRSTQHRPAHLAASLEETSRALRARPGFVLLESALAGPDSITLMGSDPDLVVEGTSRDWPAFEAELRRRLRPSADLGFPEGAAIGWLGYDGRFCFGFYEDLHIHLHRTGSWHNPPALSLRPPAEPRFPRIDFRPRMTREDYIRAVQRTQEYIAAGDIYQACLCHLFEADFRGDAWPFYEALRQYSPSPHAAFLDLNGVQIASSSPECFLRMSGRRIVTRPIKGTRPRHADIQHDQRNAYDLLTSQKEIAELVMITDLERNDLGRICDYGTVTVPELLKLESYEQVHHLVSTVTGTLREGVSHAEALRVCSPGGSITGAPKKRAMEIIAELEPDPRGPYTGAIGYFGYNGESQFSIAIRTAVFANGQARFGVGAGIVADSSPEKEWQETLHKAAGILQAAQAES